MLENGIVQVGDAADGWGWEHLEDEVGGLVGTWSSVFEVFDYFCNIVGGYGDFWTGREGVCVLWANLHSLELRYGGGK